MTIKCSFCQFINEDSSIFCHNCGRELNFSVDSTSSSSRLNNIRNNNNFSNLNNSNPNLRKNYNRDILERLKSKTWNDLLVPFSLILNFLTFILIYDFSSSLVTSLYDFTVLLFLLFVIFPLTINESRNKTSRYIMFFFYIIFFEFSLFTSNLILFLISVYQLVIKGFSPQLYDSSINIQKKRSKNKILEVTIFLLCFSIPRLLQGPNTLQNTNNFFQTFFVQGFFPKNISVGEDIAIYFLWVIVFSFIFLAIYVKGSFIHKLKISQKSSVAIFLLVVLGTSFLVSTNSLALDQNNHNYNIASFSANNQDTIAYIEYNNINLPDLLVIKNLMSNIESSAIVPNCEFIITCSLNFISNNSVVVGYHDYSNYIFISDILPNYNYTVFRFTDGKPSELNFKANQILISNQTIWALKNKYIGNSTQIDISSINKPLTTNFVINVKDRIGSYFLSSDLSKLVVEETSPSNITFNFYNLIKSFNPPDLMPEFLSSILINTSLTNLNNFRVIKWAGNTGTFYYMYDYNTVTQFYSYNIFTNKTTHLGFGLIGGISINEKYSLLCLSGNGGINVYSFKNSSFYSDEAPLSTISVHDWNAPNLIGINKGEGKWVLSILNPNTYQVTQKNIPISYFGQNQGNLSNLINRIIYYSFIVTGIVCIVLLIIDLRRYLMYKLMNRSNSISFRSI